MNLSSLCRLTIPSHIFYLKDNFILYWHNYVLWMLWWPRSSARTDGLIPWVAGSATRWQPSPFSPLQEIVLSWRESPFPRPFPLSRNPYPVTGQSRVIKAKAPSPFSSGTPIKLLHSPYLFSPCFLVGFF